MFSSLLIKSQCHKFFELFLGTTITVLKPVSCGHVASLWWWWQEVKGSRPYLLLSSEQYYAWQYLPWKCEAENNLLFCFLFLFLFLCGVIFLFSSGWKRWNQFYHYDISGYGEILNYYGLRKMRLISLQWYLKS